jgi:hypothetical protein
MRKAPKPPRSLAAIWRTHLKKLLIALGVSSALMLGPAIAQTSTDTTAPAAEKPMKAAKPAKKPAHHAKKPMKPKEPAAEAPKT